MKAKERLKYISEAIKENGKCKVADLSARCDVTEETIRRDLDTLENAGLITRTHGGAVWNADPQAGNIHFMRRQSKNAAAKRTIARAAAKYLEGVRTMAADSSSTVIEALKLMSSWSDLTVVTNSSEIFLEVRNASAQLISTGGVFNQQSMSFQGEMSRRNLEQFNFDTALIGCKGLDEAGGIFDSYENEVDLKRMMIARAGRVVLLADHTKFGQKAFLKIADIRALACIVTDVKPPDEWVKLCEENEITLICGE